MKPKIVEGRAPLIQGQAVVFAATDGIGELNIWVTSTRWEEWWLQTAEPATDEDRLDFALGMVETAAAAGEASIAENGSRILFVG